MKSIGVTQPGRLELVDIPKPRIGPYEVLVKTELSFICNATDKKVIEGHFPGIEASAYPVLLGHETVGIVEAAGGKVRNFTEGRRTLGGLLLETGDPGYTSGWGGFSEYVVISDYYALLEDGPESDINEVFRIMKAVDDDIPPEAAGMLCTWREVLGGFSDFALTGKESLVIFGAGPVGLSFAAFAKILGFPKVVSIDPIPEKRELAVKLGADAAFAPGDSLLGDVREVIGGPADAVIDAVGSVKIINSAFDFIGLGGSVCVYGVLSDETLPLQKKDAPLNFNLYMHQWPTRAYEEAAQERLCAWIREGILDWNDFVTGQFSLNQFSEAFEESRKPGTVKTLIRF